jgi:hypothetical protein
MSSFTSEKESGGVVLSVEDYLKIIADQNQQLAKQNERLDQQGQAIQASLGELRATNARIVKVE